MHYQEVLASVPQATHVGIKTTETHATVSRCRGTLQL